jgi:hypothetical protein
MARPIKRLQAAPDVVKELRRRSRSTTIGARDVERANIILLRRDGARCDCRRAKPYKWMAEGAEILAKIKRARAALDNAEA